MNLSGRKFQIFVSSTFTDLQAERLAAISCIENMGLIAAGMEKFPAGNRHAWDQITATIDESDYYILLLGTNYGSLGPGNQYSYTEMEYRYALERRKPIASFVRRICEATPDVGDPKLIAFKELVKQKMVQFWISADDLPLKIATSVHQLIQDYPAHGWARRKNSGKESRRTANIPAGKQKIPIEELIGNSPWINGAVNFDEDLHFSSFYLRRSVRQYLPAALKEFGYTKLIAIFDDMNEKYFIQRDECLSVAQRLVERMRRDPTWFQKAILDEIHVRVINLDHVFSEVKNLTAIHESGTEELIDLYRKHKTAHEKLYEVARVPEALDRGVGFFTGYLKEIIREKSQGSLNEEEQALAFDAMTYPEEPSLYLQEHAALQELAHDIQKEIGAATYRGTAKRLLMSLSPTAKEKINAHRDKWWFWGYHGYGARARGDLEDYLERMEAILTKDADIANPSRATQQQAEKRRHDLFIKLDVLPAEQYLFLFFPRIGNAKLSRRFAQLKNFYFLDNLLSALASRLSMTETHLRSLLPEEVLKIATKTKKSRWPTPQEIAKRSRYSVYILTEMDECVYGGDEFRWVEAALDASNQSSGRVEPELRGASLCSGVAKGIARIINRPDDALRSGFRPGDILVSQSGDPDIAKWIEMASGVLIEQGGVTCHAAVICREFSKPGISAIPQLMRTVQNGDFVEVDAYRGVARLRSSTALQVCRRSTEIADSDVAKFGSKAVTLAKLRRTGLSVPNFFAVPIDALGLDLPDDARGVARNAVAREIEELLGGLTGPVFIIRSSMRDEDSEGTVSAGQYVSEGNIDREDVVPCVLNAVDRVGREFPSTSGCIFVQEMVLGDYSGICFTKHPVNNVATDVLIEAVPGGNDLLTDGVVSPAAYTFSRSAEQFEVNTRNPSWKNLLSREMLRRIVTECDKAATLLGGPQDIEWTVKEGALWLLQSRAINRIGSGRQIVARTQDVDGHLANDISEIARAYRVPPNLKLHLLRVAAVGDWICQHWSGSSLDRNRIKTALLLHDVGNIVKADYESNPGLFPEELRNLRYWIAVQENVRRRFGATDVAASIAIANEIGVPSLVIRLMEEKQFVNNKETASSTDFERKIAAYADQRVSPYGVVSLKERLWEAKERYRNIQTASVNVKNFDELFESAMEIENQIEKWCKRPLSEITDEVIKPIMERLRTEKIF